MLIDGTDYKQGTFGVDEADWTYYDPGADQYRDIGLLYLFKTVTVENKVEVEPKTWLDKLIPFKKTYEVETVNENHLQIFIGDCVDWQPAPLKIIERVLSNSGKDCITKFGSILVRNILLCGLDTMDSSANLRLHKYWKHGKMNKKIDLTKFTNIDDIKTHGISAVVKCLLDKDIDGAREYIKQLEMDYILSGDIED